MPLSVTNCGREKCRSRLLRRFNQEPFHRIDIAPYQILLQRKGVALDHGELYLERFPFWQSPDVLLRPIFSRFGKNWPALKRNYRKWDPVNVNVFFRQEARL